MWPELSQYSSLHREGLLCLPSHWGDPPCSFFPPPPFPSLLPPFCPSFPPLFFLLLSLLLPSSPLPSLFLPSLQGLEYIGLTRGSRLALAHPGNPSSSSSSPWLLVWHPLSYGDPSELPPGSYLLQLLGKNVPGSHIPFSTEQRRGNYGQYLLVFVLPSLVSGLWDRGIGSD